MLLSVDLPRSRLSGGHAPNSATGGGIWGWWDLPGPGLTPAQAKALFHAAPANPATHQLPPPSRAEHHAPYLTPFSPQPSLDRADCPSEKGPSDHFLHARMCSGAPPGSGVNSWRGLRVYLLCGACSWGPAIPRAQSEASGFQRSLGLISEHSQMPYGRSSHPLQTHIPEPRPRALCHCVAARLGTSVPTLGSLELRQRGLQPKVGQDAQPAGSVC